MDTLPLRGYSRCIRIWRETGLIKSNGYVTYNPEQVERLIEDIDNKTYRLTASSALCRLLASVENALTIE
jgi:hypothetical protein